ncbi:MAG: hypothetical protein OCC49_00695 [Fibrobacterales bacterium]
MSKFKNLPYVCRLTAISAALISLTILFSCTTQNEEDCVERPIWKSCISTPSEAGDITIEATINEENPQVTVTIYAGDFELNQVVLTKLISESKTFFSLPVGSYSATINYAVGDKFITAVDGGSLENSSIEYCEGICYEEVEVTYDLTLGDWF